MSGNNTVEQVVKLNTKQYTQGLSTLKNATKEYTNESYKDLMQQARVWQANENQVKESTNRMMKNLKELGKSLKETAIAGTAINIARSASNFVTSATSNAIKAVLSIDEAMSRIEYKYGKLKNSDEIKKTLNMLGKQTGTHNETIGGAFEQLATRAGPEEGLGLIKKVTAFAGGTSEKDAGKVSEFLTNTLEAEGKKLSTANAQIIFDAVTGMHKHGGFANKDEAMAAFAEMDPNSRKRLGIGENSAAAMLGAVSSGAGDKHQALSAMNEIVKGAASGFAGNAVLNGILGANIIKNGQLNPEELTKASSRFKSKGYSDQGFAQISGLSEEASNGLANILRNAETVKSNLSNQRPESTQAANEILNDNIAGSLNKSFQGITGAFSDLLGHLAEMDFGKALGDIGRRWDDFAKAAVGFIGGGIATAWGAKTIMGMLPGAGAAAGGAAAGTGAAAAGVGAAAVETGVVAGAGAGTGVAGTGMALGGTGALIGGALTVGAAGLGAGLGIGGGMLINKYGPTMNGKTSEGYEGGALERLFFKLDKLFGGDASANFMKAQKVQVEVDSKDPAYIAKPKALDNNRDPRGL